VNVVIALGLFVPGGAQALLNPSTVEAGARRAVDTINSMRSLFNCSAFPMGLAPRVGALLAHGMTYARATQVAALSARDRVSLGFSSLLGIHS